MDEDDMAVVDGQLRVHGVEGLRVVDADREFQYKKDKIIELKRAFPYLRDNADLMAEVTDSSVGYVNEFQTLGVRDSTKVRISLCITFPTTDDSRSERDCVRVIGFASKPASIQS